MKTLNKSTMILGIILSVSGLQAQENVARFEFDDAKELKNWKRFHKEEGWPDMMKSIRVEEGKLLLEPFSCGWYADYHAPFLYHEVVGDFRVTAKVHIKGVKGNQPRTTWSLSGIMVRSDPGHSKDNWKPNEENWLFLTTGVADDIKQPVFETKTTVNSRSILKLHPNKLDPVELSIERKGSAFLLQYRYEGGEWMEIERFERADMPDRLQVGLNAYTDFYGASRELRADYMKYNTTVLDVNPDLSAEYEYFVIEN